MRTQLPPGWSVDTTSALYARNPAPAALTVPPRDELRTRLRLVAPRVDKPQWQTLTWTATVGTQVTAPISLRIYVR